MIFLCGESPAVQYVKILKCSRDLIVSTAVVQVEMVPTQQRAPLWAVVQSDKVS